jgi:hypothetical protein
MKEKELKKLVDNALALHRQMADKSEQLKCLKAHLVEQARLNPESLVLTESGGKRWTAKGSDGAIARVSFPAPGIVSEIDPESEKGRRVLALAGDDSRRLFNTVWILQPVKHFRENVAALFSKRKGDTLLGLCENEIAPRVSFEVAQSSESTPE